MRQIHVHCLPKFEQDVCEVCGEPIMDVRKLPEDVRDKVYVPSVEEASTAVEIDLNEERAEQFPRSRM